MKKKLLGFCLMVCLLVLAACDQNQGQGQNQDQAQNQSQESQDPDQAQNQDQEPVLGPGQGQVDREGETLLGYIVIKDNTLYFDQIEVLREEDADRIEELGLEPDVYLPTGFHFYNESNEISTYLITDETTYYFTDVELLFIDEKDKDGNRAYTTNKLEEFMHHRDPYSDGPWEDDEMSEQKIPYHIKVKDGKVISITEEFAFTI